MSTIADKLIAAAQNEQRIYKKGYDKGVADAGGTVITKPEVEGNYNITANGSYTYTPPADSVFSRVNVEVAVSGGTEDLNDVLTAQEEKLAELSAILDKKADDGSYDEGYADGFEDGKAEGGGSNNDNPLYYATKMNSTYDGAIFPEGTSLVLKFQKPTSLDGESFYRTFYKSSGLKSVKIITDDTKTAWAFNQSFYLCANIETIDLSECSRNLTGNCQHAFNAPNLKSILGALDWSQVTNQSSAFNGAVLEEVRFVPYSIKITTTFRSGNLTPASLDSIIDGLADLTGGTAQTLGLDQAGKNLTEDQKARIAAKNWTYTHW